MLIGVFHAYSFVLPLLSFSMNSWVSYFKIPYHAPALQRLALARSRNGKAGKHHHHQTEAHIGSNSLKDTFEHQSTFAKFSDLSKLLYH